MKAVVIVEGKVTKFVEGSTMVDVTAPSHLQIVIRNDSKTVWINVEGICMFRACDIRALSIDDRRVPNE